MSVFALPAGIDGVPTGPGQVVVGPAVVTPAGEGATGSAREHQWFGSFQIVVGCSFQIVVVWQFSGN